MTGVKTLTPQRIPTKTLEDVVIMVLNEIDGQRMLIEGGQLSILRNVDAPIILTCGWCADILTTLDIRSGSREISLNISEALSTAFKSAYDRTEVHQRDLIKDDLILAASEI